MQTEHIRLDMAGAERLVTLLNAGGWAGIGPRYQNPDGPVTAEIAAGLFLHLRFQPKDRAGSLNVLAIDVSKEMTICSDPLPEAITYRRDVTEDFNHPQDAETTLVHVANRRSNIRRLRRRLNGRLERVGVGCAWDEHGVMTFTFPDGVVLRMR